MSGTCRSNTPPAALRDEGWFTLSISAFSQPDKPIRRLPARSRVTAVSDGCRPKPGL
jgi:hypothetical protein